MVERPKNEQKRLIMTKNHKNESFWLIFEPNNHLTRIKKDEYENLSNLKTDLVNPYHYWA